MPQSIAINTAVSLFGRALQVILGFAVIAALSRLLGESGFGTYSTILAYGSLLLIGADFGLYLTFTRESSRHLSHAAAILSDVLWLRAAGLLVVFGIGSVVLGFLPTIKHFPLAFWVAAAGLSAQSVSQLLMGVFQTHASVWRASAGDLVGRATQLALVLGLPALTLTLFPDLLGNPVTTMMVAFTLATLAALTIHLWLLPLKWRLLPPPSLVRLRRIVNQSWPFAVLLVLNAIYFRIDILLLSFFRPESEVGWYSLSYRIIESALFVPAMFGGLLLPHLSRSQNFPVQLFKESLHAVILVGSGACLILALLSGGLIRFLSGPAFTPAAPLLATLSLALLVMFIGNVFGFTLVSRGRERSLMWLYLALAVFNVVANLLTIPRFGATAAAWVTVATEVVAATVAGVLVYRLSAYSLSGVFLGKLLLVLGAVAMLFLLLPASWHVLFQAAVAGATFTGLALALKLVSAHQFRLLLTKP